MHRRSRTNHRSGLLLALVLVALVAVAPQASAAGAAGGVGEAAPTTTSVDGHGFCGNQVLICTLGAGGCRPIPTSLVPVVPVAADGLGVSNTSCGYRWCFPWLVCGCGVKITTGDSCCWGGCFKGKGSDDKGQVEPTTELEPTVGPTLSLSQESLETVGGAR